MTDSRNVLRGIPFLLAIVLLAAVAAASSVDTPEDRPFADARPHLTPPDPSVQTWPPFVKQGEVLPPSSPAQTTGVARVIVLLVEFQDVQADPGSDAAYFDGIFNVEGPSAGSVRAYYQEVSFGALTVNATIIPTRWQSSRNMAYYGEDSSTGVDDANGAIYHLVVEAVRAADPFVDFAPFDADSDGVVDHVVVVHAGASQENTPGNTDLIWSHRWAVLDADAATPGAQSFRADGVQVFGYIMVGEFSPIGVVTHEFGHDLGLPDLYDTDGSSAGVGVWDLMGSGSWNGFPAGSSPAHLGAWCRIQMGWATVVDVTGSLVATSIPSVETTGDLYRLHVRSTFSGDEYFLIENRQPVGFDAALPGFGLLIWHVDDAVADNENDARRLVDLEEADEAMTGDRPLDASDPWRDSAAGFGPDTVPNSDAYDGSQSGWRVRDISASGDPMIATIARTIERDVAISEIRIPAHAARNEIVPVSVVILNEGIAPESVSGTADVYHGRIDASSLVTIETFQEPSLSEGVLAYFNFTFTPTDLGRHLVRATVGLGDAPDGDEIPSNNERVAHVLSNEYAFRDDVETGVGSWIRDGLSNDPHRWEIVDDADEDGSSHSPTHAWRFGYVPTLLPNPLPPRWHTLTSPTIPVSAVPTFLVFYHRYDLWGRAETPLPVNFSETDHGYVEVRTFDGAWSPWSQMAHYQGRDPTWRGVSINLTDEVIGATSFEVRFNVSSDITPDSGGWWVDDVMIAEIGLGRAVVLLGPAGPVEGTAGVVLDVDLKAVNVGELEDTFVLDAALPAQWTVQVRTASGDVSASGFRLSLAPDRDLTFRLRVRPAPDAAAGSTYTVTIRASSEADTAASDAHDIAVSISSGSGFFGVSLDLLLILVAILIPAVLIVAIVAARRRRPRR